MQMLAVVGGDGKRLLRHSISFVAVAVRTTAVGIGLVALDAIAVGALVHIAATTLALHFAVGQEAARHSARAPRLAVCPPPHACFPLVPHKDRT